MRTFSPGLTAAIADLGIEVVINASAEHLARIEDGIEVRYRRSVDAAFYAVGWLANVEGLDLAVLSRRVTSFE